MEKGRASKPSKVRWAYCPARKGRVVSGAILSARACGVISLTDKTRPLMFLISDTVIQAERLREKITVAQEAYTLNDDCFTGNLGRSTALTGVLAVGLSAAFLKSEAAL